ncbi:response regulator transcription factor [Paraburkholderia sp. GAS32]|uniref:response regulator transcription factor n=1 Tax=Paraburkholderia sp. GAS32 TaxID=3035129 RepID=UPI003D1A54E9
MKPLILVVDGDATCRDALRLCLQSSGFDVAVLYTPDKVVKRVEEERPALIVMTGGTISGSGLAALQGLRDAGDDVPLIMLGEQDDVAERIFALESGADDFISKPFNAREVTMRVRAVLRRVGQFSLQDPIFKPLFRFNDFELDYVSRTLTRRGAVVPLLQTEYAVLNLFTTAPGQVFSKEVIAQRVRPDAAIQLAAVRIWVHHLRRRIERDASAPELIQTVRAEGYVFRPEGDSRSLSVSKTATIRFPLSANPIRTDVR